MTESLPPQKLAILAMVAGLFAIVTSQTIDGTFSIFMTAFGAAVIVWGALMLWRSRRD